MLTTPRSRCGAKPPEERKAGGKYIVSIEKVVIVFNVDINNIILYTITL